MSSARQRGHSSPSPQQHGKNVSTSTFPHINIPVSLDPTNTTPTTTTTATTSIAPMIPRQLASDTLTLTSETPSRSTHKIHLPQGEPSGSGGGGKRPKSIQAACD